jgi:hypothetical protein
MKVVLVFHGESESQPFERMSPLEFLALPRKGDRIVIGEGNSETIIVVVKHVDFVLGCSSDPLATRIDVHVATVDGKAS